MFKLCIPNERYKCASLRITQWDETENERALVQMSFRLWRTQKSLSS